MRAAMPFNLSPLAACALSAGDLFQQLSLLTKFTEGEAARLARQIVSAVGHLHDHGIVHCDPSSPLLSLSTHTHPSPPLSLLRSLSQHTPLSPALSPGIVHCDLKPSNILVSEKEPTRESMTVKIADFGLSQSLSFSKGKLTEVATRMRVPSRLCRSLTACCCVRVRCCC